jgi:hypothetical protein
MAISGMPNEAFIQETLELEFKAIQPPDYWTTLRDVEWVNYPMVTGPPTNPVASQDLYTSPETHSVRLWSPDSGLGETRQQNTAELTIAMGLQLAWVVRAPRDLQRQICLARADIRTLLFVNLGRDRPGYTGQNDWGLTVVEQVKLSSDPIAPGLAIIWGLYGIEFRAPIHKG